MTSTTNPTIIFLHGTMGSVLRKESGEKVWPIVNPKEGFYKKNLIPISDNDGIEPNDSLITYKIIKDYLRSLGYEVIDWVYDWRKNNLDHIGLLKQEIQNISSEKVTILAHSMGGIIAKLCINKFSQDECMKKVDKLITIGTPWKGSMNSIKFLKYGAKVPEIDFLTYLDLKTSKELSSYFPSVYQLLPTQGYIDYLKENNIFPSNFNGDYYYDSVDFFKKILKSEFDKNHQFNNVFEEYYTYLQQDLPESIEHHEIIGTGIPTISVISEKSNKEPYAYWDDGDGSVPILSALSNSNNGNYYTYFVRKTTHNLMTSYPSVFLLVEKIIKDITLREHSKLFFSLNSSYYKKFDGYIKKVACPVNISITNNEGKVIYGNIDTISEEEIREILQSKYNVNTLGSTTYILFDSEDETDISNFEELQIEAYDKGPTSISIDKIESGKVVNRNAFETFTIDPKMKATVKLGKKISESSLELSSGDDEKTFKMEEIEFNDDKLILPTTSLDINSDYLIFKDSQYFIKEHAELSISKIEKGTFPIGTTYVNVNTHEYQLKEGNPLLLNENHLINGENIIEYYTIDKYDNTEKKKELTLYYIDKSYERIQFLFDHRQYRISIRENKFYDRMVRKLSLTQTAPKLIFDDTEGVTGSHVVYGNKERSLKIELVDIFSVKQNITLKINEKLIKQIIRGTADIQEVEQFVKDFDLSDPKFKFDMTNTGNRGNHTQLNNENLKKCTSLEIFDSIFDIKISKNIQYDVRFSVLTEHIKIKSNDSYNFVFNVLDYTLDEYVENLKLVSLFEFKINEDRYFKNTEIVYDHNTKSYSFELDLKDAKSFINNFWKSKQNNLQEAYLFIKNQHTNIDIRKMPITLENE